MAGADHVRAPERVVRDLHAGGALVLAEQHAFDLRAREDREVLPVRGGVQVAHRRRRPRTVLTGVDLEEVRTLGHGLAGVEVRPGDAGGLGGVQYGHAARVRRRDLTQAHGTVVTVVGPGVLVVLEFLVQPEGQLRVPALRAVHALPLVEVLRGGPERDARVVRRAAPEHLGACHAHERVPAVLRFDLVVPVVAGLEQFHPPVQLQHLGVVGVVAARLEQGDTHIRVLTEPRRHHGARRTRSHHHVVVGRDVLGRGHRFSHPSISVLRPVPLSVRRTSRSPRGGCSGRCAWSPGTHPARAAPVHAPHRTASCRPTPLAAGRGGSR